MRRRLRPFAFARLLMAAVVFCGIVHAGGHYFYCEALGLTLSDPCAQPASHRSSECPLAALRADHPDCCAVFTLQAMPDSAATARSQVPLAPIVGVVPPLPTVKDVGLRDARSARVALGRWRIPPKPPSEAQARLMVFLI